jgi:hypothetical protein
MPVVPNIDATAVRPGAAAAARRGRGARLHERGERIDLGERLPVREALAPDIRLGVDLAGRVPLLHLGRRHRADLVLVDHDVPHRLVAGGRAAPRTRSRRRACPSRRAGCGAGSAAPPPPPRTTMMLLHFLQRILKTLPWTLSSEIEYLAWHASQTIFMVHPA